MTGPRLLSEADLPALLLLSSAAGWNQTADDWRRVIALQPDLAFGIERDGRVVASTTAVCYGRELAWIGMVLTHPEYRRQGLARVLMERTLAELDERTVTCVKLDATDAGRPLYTQLGFEDECAIERWLRPAGAIAMETQVGEYRADPELDREAFGADRSALLRILARGEAASAGNDGFAMARPGAVAAFLGPVVARNEAAARRLVEWIVARHGREDTYWDLLPATGGAAALAREFGFQPARKLVRMRRGVAGGEGRADWIWAGAGFEFG
jgi:GNAT superfamily N-acetyltransferase